MGRLFDITTETLKREEDEKGVAIVALYDLFMEELRKKYFGFIETIENECRYANSPLLPLSHIVSIIRIKLKDDFDTVTKVVDWDLFTGMGNIKEYALIFSSIPSCLSFLTFLPSNTCCRYDSLEVTKEQTLERVNSIMMPNKSFGFEGDRYFINLLVSRALLTSILGPEELMQIRFSKCVGSRASCFQGFVTSSPNTSATSSTPSSWTQCMNLSSLVHLPLLHLFPSSSRDCTSSAHLRTGFNDSDRS